jgi:hypothetical protein
MHPTDLAYNGLCCCVFLSILSFITGHIARDITENRSAMKSIPNEWDVNAMTIAPNSTMAVMLSAKTHKKRTTTFRSTAIHLSISPYRIFPKTNILDRMLGLVALFLHPVRVSRVVAK